MKVMVKGRLGEGQRVDECLLISDEIEREGRKGGREEGEGRGERQAGLEGRTAFQSSEGSDSKFPSWSECLCSFPTPNFYLVFGGESSEVRRAG